ncbi:helix-turn-helix domain-containing protein [Serratia sp. T13T92]|uniref:helix-turn-helix domain-containing protein n=1 Tax=Serratia sp. T13T92 TaxID=3397496 RepID=UPI0039E0EB46
MHWYERARDLAAQQKVSHEAIAEKIGRGRSTVSGWLSGDREPKLDEINMLAKALGVSSRWLLFGDPEDFKPIEKTTPRDEVLVPLWNKDGQTDEVITAPADVGLNNRAYIIEKDSGCDVAPAGTRVIVNIKLNPVSNDYVVAKIQDEISVFKYLEVAGKKFLGVDEPRVPLIEIGAGVEMIGVAIFLSRKIRN